MISKLVEQFMKSPGAFPFTIFIAWLLYAVWRRRGERREEFLRQKKVFLEDLSVGISLERKDYQLDPRGIERSNPLERRFRRRYLFDLLEAFDHKCANCSKERVKFELDHFFIPKSRGGNLMVRHKEGYWVCNALLLCHKCNQRKKDLPAPDFFGPEDLKRLQKKIGELSSLINGF